MRILFVSPYFPIPQRSGGKVRVFNVLRELAQTEQVTLLCYLSRESEPFVSEIRKWGIDVCSIPREIISRPLLRHVQYLPTPVPFSIVDPDRRMRDLVRTLWAEEHYDLVQVEFLAMGYVACEAAFEGRRFLTHHYSATDHYRRSVAIRPKWSTRYWYDSIELLKVRQYERSILARFTNVFVTSEQDRKLLSAVSPGANLVVANNGVDAKFYQRSLSTRCHDSRLLVSTCSFKTDANIDSVVWFLEAIWPQIRTKVPDARYEVIGFDPPASVFEAARRAKGVTVLGGVDDVRPYLERSAASVITMRAGSGTKIRALTSLAMGCPIVATPLGAEGLQASEHEGLFVRETPEAIARLAVHLLAGGTPQSVPYRAREFVIQHHSWRNTVDIMRATYAGTLRQ